MMVFREGKRGLKREKKNPLREVTYNIVSGPLISTVPTVQYRVSKQK